MYREYETFAREFPDRPLVPMRGDTTALPPRLQVRQYSDFCPLLNDLFDTVRDLKAKRVGNRQIRAVVLNRFQAEGVELPPDQHNLLFGLFGIPGWMMLPLYYLLRWRDLLADKLSGLADEIAQKLAAFPTASYYTTKLAALPVASYYTAGVAVTTVTAGFVTCYALSGSVERPFIEFIDKIRAEAVTGRIPIAEVIDRITRHDEKGKARPVQVDEFIEKIQAEAAAEDVTVAEVIDRITRHHDEAKVRATTRLQQPDLFPVVVRLDQSGNNACDAQGMICVSMSQARVVDINGKFFGYSTPTCSATVIRRSSCSRDYQTDYALNGVVLRRSPEADAGVQDLSRFGHFCLSSEKEKQGIFQFANCVKP